MGGSPHHERAAREAVLARRGVIFVSVSYPTACARVLLAQPTMPKPSKETMSAIQRHRHNGGIITYRAPAAQAANKYIRRDDRLGGAACGRRRNGIPQHVLA